MEYHGENIIYDARPMGERHRQMDLYDKPLGAAPVRDAYWSVGCDPTLMIYKPRDPETMTKMELYDYIHGNECM